MSIKALVTDGLISTPAEAMIHNGLGNFAQVSTVPVLNSISPTRGKIGTTVSVTLHGANFIAGATVAVSGTGVTVGTVTVVNDSTIQTSFTIAAGATLGPRNVSVTTSNGTSGTVVFNVGRGGKGKLENDIGGVDAIGGAPDIGK